MAVLLVTEHGNKSVVVVVSQSPSCTPFTLKAIIASGINYVNAYELVRFTQTGTQTETDSDTNGIDSTQRPHEVMGNALS